MNIECKLVAEFDAGDHTLFVGEAVATHITKSDERLLFDMGGRNFWESRSEKILT